MWILFVFVLNRRDMEFYTCLYLINIVGMYFLMIKKIVLIIVTFVIIAITLPIPDNDNIALECIVLQTMHRCKKENNDNEE